MVQKLMKSRTLTGVTQMVRNLVIQDRTHLIEDIFVGRVTVALPTGVEELRLEVMGIQKDLLCQYLGLALYMPDLTEHQRRRGLGKTVLDNKGPYLVLIKGMTYIVP